MKNLLEKITFSTKRVTIFTFYIGILGLLSHLFFHYYLGDLYNTNLRPWYALKSLFEPINLSYFRLSFSSSGIFPLNFIHIWFYSMTLIGGILYVVREGKETRLLRFAFSVICFLSFIGLFNSVLFNFITGFNHIGSNFLEILSTIIGILLKLVFAILSFKALVFLNEERTLAIKTLTLQDGTIQEKVLVSNNFQRIFHWIFDIAIMLLCLSQFLIFFSSFGPLSPLFTVLALFLYYVFFEHTFGATPAKMLTESRVINLEREEPILSTVLTRTLVRFVPLEAFSFLGSGRGWHDEWSKTIVVTETNDGIKGAKYWWLIPFYIVLGVGVFVINETIEDIKREASNRKYHERKMAEGKRTLDNISTNYFLGIEEQKNYRNPSKYFLKPEKIEGKEITCSVIPVKSLYSSTPPLSVERKYKTNKDLLEQVIINKDSLYKSFYSDYGKRKGTAILLKDGKPYELKKIFLGFGPIIETSGSGSRSGDQLSLQMENWGWPANLIAINILEGSIIWKNTLPLKIASPNEKNYAKKFSLTGINNDHKPYKVELIFQDTLNRNHTYILEGTDMERTLFKKE